MTRKTISFDVEISTILHEDGIAVFVGDSEEPDYFVSIDALAEEMLSMFTVPATAPAGDPNRYVPADSEHCVNEVTLIAQALETAARRLRTALEKGAEKG